MNTNLTYLAIFLVAQCIVNAEEINAEEVEWGDLQGRFVFDGVPPEPQRLPIDKDRNSFPLPILDESLVVNTKNGGLANVVLYLLPSQEVPLHVHPNYDDDLNSKVELVMQGGRFEPHILLLRTTQTMLQRNKDCVIHNARIDFFNNAPR